MKVNKYDDENRMRGAFLGDNICVLKTVSIQKKKVKIRYRVRSKKPCKLVLKSRKNLVEITKRLRNDNRWHFVNVSSLEAGEYEMYVVNIGKEFVQYDIKIFS